MRSILHSDLNNFFASVELKKYPELRDKPVAVGGDESKRHGIVLAKNEAAKLYKIKTGESLHEARQKCPQLTVLPPHYDEYMHYSRAAREIYYRYTDLIEPFGIDEAWLDVSASLKLWPDAMSIAEEIRAACKKELGLTVSIGVSFNKVFAKLGSDMKKPDAVTEITPENFRRKVWPLPVTDLLFVGRATAEKLHRHGVYSIGELAACTPEYLRSFLGKPGAALWYSAAGRDESPVRQYGIQEDAKSIGRGSVSPCDMYNIEQTKPLLYMLADAVASRCRKKGVRAEIICLHVKDDLFCVRSMQTRLPAPSATAYEFYHTALELLRRQYLWQRPVYALTLTALLAPKSGFEQTELFAEHAQQLAAEEAVDRIRERFGSGAIKKAITLKDSHGIKIEEYCSFSK